jgi:hypothetical protein
MPNLVDDVIPDIDMSDMTIVFATDCTENIIFEDGDVQWGVKGFYSPCCCPAASQIKASPRFSTEKRRKSKVDEARDILAHVVVCHVSANKYNFHNKLS